MDRARVLVAALGIGALVFACAQGAEPTTDPNAGVDTSQSGTDPAPSASASSTSSQPSTPPQTTADASAGTDDTARAPAITSIAPNKAPVGSVGPTIVVTGNDFVARTVVQLDGAPLATTFVSATELRATIPTTSLANVGTLMVSAGTSPPGGGASKELTFSVENPAPTLTQLSPLSAVAGSPDTQVTLTGTGFVSGTTVTAQGTMLTVKVQDAQTITATIPATMLGTSGTLDIVATNPTPGGGASGKLSFTVSNPSVQLSSISPTSVLVNSAATTITVNGSGFVASSTVLENGAAVPTTFVNATTLTAVVPASALTSVGDFPVAVKSPPPGGGVSMPLSFRVQYAAPTVTSAAPTPIGVGAGATAVTVTGTNFYPASQVLFNGAATATSFVSSTQLTATLTAAQLSAPGAISVTVNTPSPGGGTSNMASISVQNPMPVITVLSPGSLVVGAADTLLTVTGTGFVSTSVLQSNGGNLATTYVSATSLKATIPAAQMASPGSLNITVMSPSPGGGTSAPKTLTVGCDTSGVTLPLGAIGTVTTRDTNFSTAPTYTRFNGSSTCQATYATDSQPGRFYVVQNTAGVPVTLSVWAVCPDTSGQDDAYITFYNGSTVPVSDAARAMCANWISEGSNGYDGFSSPESGMSGWCPGLTKANGGGLALSACQKAVVFVQPYSMTSTSYLPPPQIRFKPE